MRTVQYTGEGITAEIVIGKATVAAGLLRSRLVDEGLRAKDDDALVHALRWTQYPALVAATQSGHIDLTDGGYIQAKEVTFMQFLELPEDLGMLWLDAVFAENPHWIFSAPPKDEEGNE